MIGISCSVELQDISTPQGACVFFWDKIIYISRLVAEMKWRESQFRAMPAYYLQGHLKLSTFCQKLQNVRSIWTKPKNFRLSDPPFFRDVIMLIETWVKPSIFSAELGLNNHHIFRGYRNSNTSSMSDNGGSGWSACLHNKGIAKYNQPSINYRWKWIQTLQRSKMNNS